MKLDYKTVAALSGMSDEKLWMRLRMLSSGIGVEVPERRRQRIRYEAIRCVLRAMTPEDVARVNQMLEIYQNAGRRERYGERYF